MDEPKRRSKMNHPRKKLISLATGLLCTGVAVAAAPDASDDSITIYSRLQPGAVSPDLYRPVSGR